MLNRAHGQLCSHGVSTQGRAIDIKGNALNTEVEKAMSLIGESLKVLPSSVSSFCVQSKYL